MKTRRNKLIFSVVLSVSLSVGVVPLSGATMIVSDLISTTAAFSDGDATDAFPMDDTIDQYDLVNNKGIVGVAESIASELGLSVGVVNPGDFIVTGGVESLKSTLNRTSTPGSGVEGSALSRYDITFTLGASESGNLLLNFDYLLSSDSPLVELNWSLVGPDPMASVFSGALSTSTTLSGSTSQSANINTAGSYTLTVIAEVPLVSLNSTSMGVSEVSNFQLSYSIVPEPSLISLLCGFFAHLALRRSR